MIKRIISTIFIAAAFTSCASIPTYNSIHYTSSDNKFVTLLELEYENRKYHNISNPERGLSQISYGTNRVGKEIKIKWQDLATQETKKLDIALDKGLPFNMNGAKIRLIFNESRQPELYVVYNGPDPYLKFKFKGYFYTGKKVRQVYPIIREIKFDAKIINKSYV